MKARMAHYNIHVLDAEKSKAFYKEAVGLEVKRIVGPEDGSWGLIYLGNDTTDFELELTWNEGRTDPYNNGGEDNHLAFVVEDYAEALALHQSMGCVVYVNEDMGIHFLLDPDGCWVEIMPA
jgi:lactoylglutathione lyase